MKNGEERTVCCRICEKPFTARANNAKYCPACKKEKQDEIEREKRAAKQRKMRAAKKQKNVKSEGSTLAEIAAKAKELHMSYGEYVMKFGG